MVQKKYSDATRDKQIGNALRSLFYIIYGTYSGSGAWI